MIFLDRLVITGQNDIVTLTCPQDEVLGVNAIDTQWISSTNARLNTITDVEILRGDTANLLTLNISGTVYGQPSTTVNFSLDAALGKIKAKSFSNFLTGNNYFGVSESGSLTANTVQTSSTLIVGGDATFFGSANISGTVDISGITTTSDLAVHGAATFSSTTSFISASTFNKEITAPNVRFQKSIMGTSSFADFYTWTWNSNSYNANWYYSTSNSDATPASWTFVATQSSVPDIIKSYFAIGYWIKIVAADITANTLSFKLKQSTISYDRELRTAYECCDVLQESTGDALVNWTFNVILANTTLALLQKYINVNAFSTSSTTNVGYINSDGSSGHNDYDFYIISDGYTSRRVTSYRRTKENVLQSYNLDL